MERVQFHLHLIDTHRGSFHWEWGPYALRVTVAYSDTFPVAGGCHCNRLALYQHPCSSLLLGLQKADSLVNRSTDPNLRNLEERG